MPEPVWRGLGALLLGTAVTLLSIEFLDRPLATFAAAHPFHGFGRVAASPGVLLLLALALPPIGLLWPGTAARAPRLWRVLMLCSASVAWTAAAVELVLKRVFGRLGPQAWVSRQAFGFHWFAGGVDPLRSFPSGEAALAMAAISVLWLCYPRGRLLLALAAAVEAFLLVGLNWHFLSDVIGGGMVGAIGGMVARRVLQPPPLAN